jgi:hypothetical protein
VASNIFKPLSTIKRQAPEALLGALRNTEGDPELSVKAGLRLVAEAKSYGIEMRDYLRLACDPSQSNEKDKYTGLNGYETALAYLSLPLKDDYDAGITLELASDTFEYSPGTRALFPEVVDDLVQWKYRQTSFETLAPLLANTRTINGVELLTTVVNDTADDYKVMRPVAELAPIPLASIRTSQQTAKMYKIGGGYRTSYEFSRRARLDLLTPYAARMARELEMSKVGVATDVLINGDGLHTAASVTAQSVFNGLHSAGNATTGRISYLHLLQWLIRRAQAGYPVDRVVGNWGAYIDWLMLFALPIADNPTGTGAVNLANSGFRIGGVPILNGRVDFVLSTTMPDGQLLGMTAGETLEQLIEAGSLISESERAIQTQSITYAKSEVSGFRIVFDNTRDIFDYAH